jgi:hypothetical protein
LPLLVGLVFEGVVLMIFPSKTSKIIPHPHAQYGQVVVTN